MRTYMIGKMYEVRKKSVGANIGNENAKKQLPQNGEIDLKKNHRGTSQIIANELGIGKSTVERAEKFAKIGKSSK